MIHQAVTTALIVLTSVVLIGCASQQSKTSVLPQGGPSMKQIYDEHFRVSESRAELPGTNTWRHRPLGDRSEDLAGYTREAFDELDAIFPRLPNPVLVMYVYPHLVGSERTPVPGYATSFSLYLQSEFAMPGEKAVSQP